MKKNCVLCDSDTFNLIYDLGKYKIQRCSKCGLVRTFGEMEASYEHYHRDEEYASLDNYFRNIFQKRYNIIVNCKFKIENSSKAGRVLDIGASTGVMLDIFKSNGWETWGVEPSEAGKILRYKDIKILNTTFEKAKLPKNYFDVVIMNHTLEHVEDPIKVLKKIHQILKKGGIVYIDVPNFGSLSSHIAGRGWKFLHAYEHIHQFEPDTLKKCLQKAGFEIAWQGTWSGIFDVANPLLKFWQTLTGLKKQFFTDLIDIPGSIIATYLDRGTSLAMIGKKQ